MDDHPPQSENGETGRTPGAANSLMALVYDELREVAARHMQHERPGHTLQPTAIVHEAYLRLAELDRMQWRDRRHFLIAASGAIRRVLVDHARGRNALKRGGPNRPIALSGLESDGGGPDIDLLALDEALARLAELDDRKCRVVELRFFGGLTIQETSEALDVGTTTVEDDWAFARSWLRQRLDLPERDRP